MPSTRPRPRLAWGACLPRRAPSRRPRIPRWVQSAKEYAEIIEECETKFVKEIEFERFRDNFTFEEAEEIRQDLEKLRRWLRKVEARDWMSAGGREPARQKVAECEQLLERFEADVYERTVPD